MVYSSQDYISEMNAGGLFLREVNDGFKTATTRLQMYSFYETLETDVGPRRMVRLSFPFALSPGVINYVRANLDTMQMVVNQESAVFGYVGEKSLPLMANHHNVCKFDSPQDINYISVATAIRSLVACHRHEGTIVLKRVH